MRPARSSATAAVSTRVATPGRAATAPRTRRPWGGPQLYTSHSQRLRMLNTRPMRIGIGALVVLGAVLTFAVEDATLRVLALGSAAAIGAIGLNIVSGYAGQISLGHPFFLAIGAYTASALSGDPDGRTIGFGITSIVVWLPAAGVVAALFGVLVAPLAVRLRGLYLALVTLGLVFLGEHIFGEWRSLTGGRDLGRPGPVPELLGVQLNTRGELFTAEQKLYLLMLVMLIIFAVLASNLTRSKIGRAFAAIRDRDIAASAMGVDLTKYKTVAFGVSSFYAGIAGALIYTAVGYFQPGTFNLLLAVQYIAMVLIGGVATISGSIMGALFITMLGPITRYLADVVPLISHDPTGAINVFRVEGVLYGLLIIGFLLFEPRGLHGIWLRIRNYWKSWPFSY